MGYQGLWGHRVIGLLRRTLVNSVSLKKKKEA